MSKLPDYGAPGPRGPRGNEPATGFQSPFSRAEQARGVYQGSNPPGMQGALSGGLQPPQGGPPSQTASGSRSTAQQPEAPPPGLGPYDPAIDPVYQQVMASVNLANANAGAAALNAREQALLQYGDPGLAASVLGASDPFVQAAGQNQESTLSLLKRAYDEGLANYDNRLDPSLVYSGARIQGEGLLGQSYQDRLAAAAQAIQGQLAGITDTYNQALETNRDKLDQALSDAYARAVQSALTNPPAAPGSSAPAAPTSAAPQAKGKAAPKQHGRPQGRRSRIAHAAAARHRAGSRHHRGA